MLVTQTELESFKQIIENRLGIFLDNARITSLNELISTRMKVRGYSNFNDYLSFLYRHDGSFDEFRVLSENVTVGETYFFRYADQFEAFIKCAVPECLKRNNRSPRFEILSAGCATGEEPYSLAILVKQNETLFGSTGVSITGIDINAASIKKAKVGQYSDWSLRETPARERSIAFSIDGKKFTIKDSFKEMVIFEERNLMTDDPAFWIPGRFDIIFCRNVLMYFSTEKMRDVVARLKSALAPGGFIFLGPSETLRGLSTEFHLCHSHNVFYYKRKEFEDREVPPLRALPKEDKARFSVPSTSPEPALETNVDPSWMAEISRSAGLIEELSRKVSSMGTVVNELRSQDSGFDIFIKIYDLFARERYQEAWERLTQLHPSRDQDLDIQLLRAILLTNQGKANEAEKICEDILKVDELNANVHYLKALSREQNDDRWGAIEENNIAVYLDPTFAMAHFHLGMLLRKNGNDEKAGNHLSHALKLFDIETPVRIVLFGGGFNRNALMSLCKSELRNHER